MKNLLQAMKDGYGLLTGEGQFLVFFVLALYILWFFKKNEIKELKRYATVMLLFLLFPLTAKGLMLYATAFYGYAELWVLLPITLVTGFMLTGFTFEWAPELPFLRKYPVRREAVCIGHGSTPVSLRYSVRHACEDAGGFHGTCASKRNRRNSGRVCVRRHPGGREGMAPGTG